jgi:acetyltransferase-like isoleucine patch superfamily enzyme
VSFGSEPYLISIGDHCEITSGVKFITHDGGTWIFRADKNYEGSKFGPIKIHENCFIGLNSIILPGVEIGPGSIIGAGSVVTKRVPKNTVYAGNPAKYVCSTERYLEKCKYENPGDTGLNNHRSVTQKELLIKRFENFFDA